MIIRCSDVGQPLKSEPAFRGTVCLNVGLCGACSASLETFCEFKKNAPARRGKTLCSLSDLTVRLELITFDLDAGETRCCNPHMTWGVTRKLQQLLHKTAAVVSLLTK